MKKLLLMFAIFIGLPIQGVNKYRCMAATDAIFTTWLRSKPDYRQLVLCEAAMNNNVNTMALALLYNADINGIDKDGNMPLLCAVRNGRINAFQFLLDRGADIAARNHAGAGVLYFAHETILEYLFDKINQMDEMDLHRIFDGHINERLHDGSNPLCIASGFGAERVVDFLLKNGADVNRADADGNTPLHCAAEYNKFEIMENLLECGAVVNVRNNYGDTPLHCICEYVNDGEDEPVDAVELLLEYDADTNIANDSGFFPIDVAREHENFNITRLLINHDIARVLRYHADGAASAD